MSLDVELEVGSVATRSNRLAHRRAAGLPYGPPPADRPTMGGVVLTAATLAVFCSALLIRGQLAFGLVVLATIFVPMERLLALHPQRVLRSGWRTDVVHFVVNTVLLLIGLFVVVAAGGALLHLLVPGQVRHLISEQPTWLQISEGFAVAELGGYFGHRAAHRSPMLWRFHKVHHSVRQMDWLAANHLHPIDQVFIRSCAVLPFYALGFSRASLGGYVVLLTFQAILIHANVRIGFGWLRYVVATPQFHHWHHADAPQAYNTNFAGVFPVVDAIFGTLHVPAGSYPSRYGINDAEPSGYLRQMAWPFNRRLRTDSRVPTA